MRNGIEMGVLDNGMPYLSEKGLAHMCDIDRKALNAIGSDWINERLKTRGKKISALLNDQDNQRNTLIIKCEHNGTLINAYPENVCIALLEYYAYEAPKPRKKASDNFRHLVRTSFRDFIYRETGYSPHISCIDSWQYFHDRIDITQNSVLEGYFSVFQEAAQIIVPMIKAGLPISSKIIPDISLGRAWSIYWKNNNLSKYGARIKYTHNYPSYYPQARSNPQEAFAYPDQLIGIFRAWMKREYILNNLHIYLSGQTKKRVISQKEATVLINLLSPKTLPPPHPIN